jgi:thiol-disulfide isomerase/thioredoxin
MQTRKMRKVFFVFVGVFIFYFQSLAAYSVIEGKAPGGAGLQIRLYEYEDFISYKEKLVAVAQIDSSCKFSFKLKIYENEVKMLFFRIMYFQTVKFFLPANVTYELEIDSFYYRDPLRIFIPILSSIELPVRIKNADEKDINTLVGALQTTYEKYVTTVLAEGRDLKYNLSFQRPSPSVVKQLADSLVYFFGQYENPYFKNFFTYTLAQFYLVTQYANKTQLYREFLYNKPFLYNNLAYIQFFTSMYDNYILTESKAIRMQDLNEHIHRKVNFLALLDSLGRDTLLKNEVIREMALILNAKKWYSSRTLYFNQDSILKLLEQEKKHTRFDLHAMIIDNLLFMLTRYRSGQPVPNFQFLSLDKKPFSTDSLRGKYTYLIFFTTWSKACLQHLKVAEEIQKKWKDSLQVIPVSVDLEPISVHFFAREKKLNLTFYHFNGDYVGLEKLSVVSYPQCIFIDKNTRFIQHVALCPAEGFDAFLTSFFEKRKPKEKE